MLQKLIGFSLKYSGFILVLAVLLLAFSAFQVPKMPVDVFPELNAPTVVLLTEAGGFAADEVEQYVTFPIETAVNGLPGVRRVRSSSASAFPSCGWSLIGGRTFTERVSSFRAIVRSPRSPCPRTRMPRSPRSRPLPVRSCSSPCRRRMGA